MRICDLRVQSTHGYKNRAAHNILEKKFEPPTLYVEPRLPVKTEVKFGLDFEQIGLYNQVCTTLFAQIIVGLSAHKEPVCLKEVLKVLLLNTHHVRITSQ